MNAILNENQMQQNKKVDLTQYSDDDLDDDDDDDGIGGKFGKGSGSGKVADPQDDI